MTESIEVDILKLVESREDIKHIRVVGYHDVKIDITDTKFDILSNEDSREAFILGGVGRVMDSAYSYCGDRDGFSDWIHDEGGLYLGMVDWDCVAILDDTLYAINRISEEWDQAEEELDSNLIEIRLNWRFADPERPWKAISEFPESAIVWRFPEEEEGSE